MEANRGLTSTLKLGFNKYVQQPTPAKGRKGTRNEIDAGGASVRTVTALLEGVRVVGLYPDLLVRPRPSGCFPFPTKFQSLIGCKWFLCQPALAASRTFLKVYAGMTDAECLLAVEALKVSQQRLQRGFQ